jgi:tetratricopeptide (TPR) repeat protein
MPPPAMAGRGPLLPPPPPEIAARWANGKAQPARPAKPDPARADQLTTLGDRLFRGGNLKRAEERYQQAARADPNRAAPFLRLAQIALARGNYLAAANRLRDAQTAQPGWIITAPDIQAIYGEPTEFARQIARLESYVQSHPEDRNAWLVLGAEWFLAGRTSKAVDVFTRLNDPRRKPDLALAAFLDASNQARAEPDERSAPAR